MTHQKCTYSCLLLLKKLDKKLVFIESYSLDQKVSDILSINSNTKVSDFKWKFDADIGNNYSHKCWKVLFSELRFIEVFFSSSEVRASAEIVRDESRFGNRTF